MSHNPPHHPGGPHHMSYAPPGGPNLHSHSLFPPHGPGGPGGPGAGPDPAFRPSYGPHHHHQDPAHPGAEAGHHHLDPAHLGQEAGHHHLDPAHPGQEAGHHHLDPAHPAHHHHVGAAPIHRGSASVQHSAADALGRPGAPFGEGAALGGHARQAQHSRELIAAFRPIQYFLTIIGQMPFVVRAKKDGTYAFKFYKCSLAVMLYMLMFLISTTLYLTVTVGILSFAGASAFSYIQPESKVIVENHDEGTTDEMLWERYLVRHEMVSMIVVWSWQTVAFAGSVYIVTNPKYYVHYMNYFNRVVQIMDMDMTPGVSGYLLFNNLLSLVVAILLTLGFVAGLLFEFTAVTNTAAVISNFVFRLFEIESQEFGAELGEKKGGFETHFQIFGYCIMVYALFASRANVVQFLFFSQLLKNASKVWNERLRKVLLHENVFGTILFAYYSLTLISVVMELYKIAALQGFGAEATTTIITNENAKEINRDKLLQSRKGITTELDAKQELEVLAVAGVTLLLLAQNVFFCYRTTVDAAKAYETAMKGFDILRRHGLMYCKNKTDRNFVLSLYFSFAKNNPLQLTAGGYFAVNKILLVTMSSTVVNWAISIYQTKVDQWR